MQKVLSVNMNRMNTYAEIISYFFTQQPFLDKL